MQKCSCGHTGAVAEHLRANQHCLQGMREELSLGAEISDEVLIEETGVNSETETGRGMTVIP